MIFITGDTHRSYDYAKLKRFSADNPYLTKNDFVVVAGDFGAVWDAATLENDLKAYSSLPFTVLFVDGNHENFDLLNAYPVKTWNGGKAHVIKSDIVHLIRGQVFNLQGKSFFTFGGATSTDKCFRVEGKTWWQQELPSDKEIKEAHENLEKNGFKVDFIVTHSCDEKALFLPPVKPYARMPAVYTENRVLSYFEEKIEYGHWYFGHFHLDGDLTDKKTVLYERIIRIV